MDKFWPGFNLAIGQNAIFGEDLIWRKAQKQFFYLYVKMCYSIRTEENVYT